MRINGLPRNARKIRRTATSPTLKKIAKRPVMPATPEKVTEILKLFCLSNTKFLSLVSERVAKKISYDRTFDEKTCTAVGYFNRVMKVCDTNGSSTLSLDEVLAKACVDVQVKMVGESLNETIFAHIDANGDGELDQAEMLAAYEAM